MSHNLALKPFFFWFNFKESQVDILQLFSTNVEQNSIVKWLVALWLLLSTDTKVLWLLEKVWKKSAIWTLVTNKSLEENKGKKSDLQDHHLSKKDS